MFNQINQSNVEGSINNTNVPLLFIAGKNDTYVTADCVKDAFDIYKSEKEFKLFENSHHLIYVDEPDLFVETTKEFLLKNSNNTKMYMQ